MTDETSAEEARPRGRWTSLLVYCAAASLGVAGVILVALAFLGVGPLGFLLFPPLALAGLATVLTVAALAAALRGRHASTRSWRALVVSLAPVALGALLIPAVGVAKQQLAQREAVRVIDDVSARADYCAGRQAAALGPAAARGAIDPSSRYRRAVEVCVTEGGSFHSWPEGPQVTCWSGVCSIDLSYVDVYPRLDSRIVELEPFMERALDPAS